MNVRIMCQGFVNVIRKGPFAITVRKNKNRLAMIGRAVSYD